MPSTRNHKSLKDLVALLGSYEPNLFCITLRHSQRVPELEHSTGLVGWISSRRMVLSPTEDGYFWAALSPRAPVGAEDTHRLIRTRGTSGQDHKSSM